MGSIAIIIVKVIDPINLFIVFFLTGFLYGRGKFSILITTALATIIIESILVHNSLTRVWGTHIELSLIAALIQSCIIYFGVSKLLNSLKQKEAVTVNLTPPEDVCNLTTGLASPKLEKEIVDSTIFMITEEITAMRQQRIALSERLMSEAEKGLATFRKVSYGFAGGVLLTSLTFDVAEKAQVMLLSWVCLFLFIGYKVYEWTESKRIMKGLEAEYPHRSLYPDSPIYADDRLES